MSKGYSIMRELQYEELGKVNLLGKVLDLGGSKNADYQKLVRGSPEFTVVNIDERYGYDLKFNLEEKFPLENNSYDNVLSMNLIEHIFDTHNLFSETARVLKPGGLFVSSVPYMHHIHGSPDDFVRYTDSAYRKFAEKHGFEVVYLEPLGHGIFSLIFQTLMQVNFWRFDIVFNIIKFVCITLDQILNFIPPIKRITKNIPLGYFWIMRKK
jgi:SAM-dependent methyltransferase